MLLLVGLGNPGAKYARHRHNVGYRAIEAIARTQGFSAARKKFQSEICEGDFDGEKVLALRPQTFMNESGRAVGEAMRFYKLAPAEIIVFHDELDLAPGRLKVKLGGGNAGHNGLESIAAHIGADFRRVRIGIGHPGDRAKVTGHVLGDFAKSDAEWLEPLLDAIAAAAPHLAESDARFAEVAARHLAAPKSEIPAEPAVQIGPRTNPLAAAFAKIIGRRR